MPLGAAQAPRAVGAQARVRPGMLPSHHRETDSENETGRSRSPAVRNAPRVAPGGKAHGAQSDGFDNTTNYELQHQHLRLRRKYEERKRRYEQEKEAWMKEKEALLREVLRVQAGENRRLLLDLKSLLQVVQAELRKEEKKQSSARLQYSQDRCGWELERAQLKCRIAQLESKTITKCKDTITPNLQEVFKMEREEQKCLLADTHPAAMDVHKQLASTERNWKMEKMELLERFDSERKEWECQWKVMQKKIEELYQEVKLRRESNGKGLDEVLQSKIMQFSAHSPCSENSDMRGTTKGGSHLPSTDNKHHQHVSKRKTNEFSVDYLDCECREESERCGDSKTPKKENVALNEALSEIAKVSKELCSYQEEIRKTSHRRRMKSYPLLGEYEGTENMAIKNEISHLPHSVIQASSIMSETEDHDSRKNHKDGSRERKTMPCNATNGDACQMDRPILRTKEAPPIPPRSTSWHLASTLTVSPQAHDESPQDVGLGWVTQECKAGNTSGSPTFVNKCKATSHASQGMASKHAVMGFISSFSEKKGTGSKWKSDVCHSKWLYSGGKCGQDTNSYVQKSFSAKVMDLNHCADSSPGPHQSNGWHADMVIPHNAEGDTRESLEQTLSNGKLAAKTDEFNRIVFQTNKCSTALQDYPLPLILTGDQESFSSLLCGCSDNSVGTANVVGVSSPSLPACRKLESSCPSGSKENSGHHKQINGFHSSSSYQQMLHEHDWRPSNLSGRPRSADSRSNYGVVEKLLKNYEKSAGPSLCNSKGCGDKWTKSDCVFTDRSSETLSQYLEMLQIEQPTREVPRNPAMPTGHTFKQDTGTCNLPEVPSPGKSLSRKGFSRPACPANRRLPSRWASRSPSAPLSVRGCHHSYSLAFLSETSVL